MKRVLFFLFLTTIVNFGIYSDPIIKRLQPTKEIKGSAYFPLFVGEKWFWEISVNENRSTMSWEIISYNIINDPSNDLKNVYGYEATGGSDIGNWYFIEYDGFICSYQLLDKNYTIVRLFPINPQIEDIWSIAGDNYSITLIDKEKVKIEYENEEEKRFGYQIFMKNVGFSELFESSKKNEGKNILKYKLTDYIDNSKVDLTKYEENKKTDLSNEKKSEEKEIVIKEKKEDKITIEKKEDNTTKVIVSNTLDNINITKLLSDRSYIQISSFNSSKNALNYSESLRLSGFSPKILEDFDGYYKVVLDTTSDEKEFLELIRNKIEKKAFIKQRKK